jgi:hypothetical protein
MTREDAVARARSWNAWIMRDAKAWQRYEDHQDRARYLTERGPMPATLATTTDFAALASV